jgi:hypothetical protein
MRTDPQPPWWRTPLFAVLVIAAAALVAYHKDRKSVV